MALFLPLLSGVVLHVVALLSLGLASGSEAGATLVAGSPLVKPAPPEPPGLVEILLRSPLVISADGVGMKLRPDGTSLVRVSLRPLSTLTQPRTQATTKEAAINVLGSKVFENLVELHVAAELGVTHSGSRPYNRRWGSPFMSQDGKGQHVLASVGWSVPLGGLWRIGTEVEFENLGAKFMGAQAGTQATARADDTMNRVQIMATAGFVW